MLTRDDIERLTPEEKILLVEEIWESLGSKPENVPVSEAEKEELERRFAEHQRDPDAAISLAEFKERLAKRL